MSSSTRAVTSQALRAFERSPVLILEGARGAGKSRLARDLAGSPSRAVSLDNSSVRSLAVDDPDELLAGSPGTLILTEVQRMPSILDEIAKRASESKMSGQFILTSSVKVDLLSVPKKLRKRMRVVTVHTPSRSELLGRGGAWLSLILGRRWPSPKPVKRDELAHLLSHRSDTGPTGLRQRIRSDWIETHLNRVLNDDALSIGATQPALLRALIESIAAEPASELNTSALSRLTGASRGTVDKHIRILESLFLIEPLAGWSEGITSRPIHRPKLHLGDTRLSAAIAGYSSEALAEPTGHLLLRSFMEQMVVNELTRQAAVSPMPQELWHFRDRNGLQVPLVIDTPEGIVAVDVQAARRLLPQHVRALSQFRDRAAGRFRAGMVLYMGKAATLGDRLHALPINSLWEHSRIR